MIIIVRKFIVYFCKGTIKNAVTVRFNIFGLMNGFHRILFISSKKSTYTERHNNEIHLCKNV